MEHKHYRVCKFETFADALNMLNNTPKELICRPSPEDPRTYEYFYYDEDENFIRYAELIHPAKTGDMTEVRLYGW